jgi:hypothetical protein
LGSKLNPCQLLLQSSLDVMARDMALPLLLAASALAAQDGPVHAGLRGAVGNSSDQALPRRASSAPCGASSRIGKNSQGTNLRQADWSNVAEECCSQCNGLSACQAWTWIEGSHECWLKSWVPDESQWVSEGGVTSGLRSSTPTPPSTPAPTASYVDACGCDCQWLGQDDCVRSVDPPAWNDDKCSNRCRVANGITERRCYYNQGSRAVWTRKANNNPTDTSDCNCQWMASDYGFGDDCKGGCDPSDCAYKCRQANPWGTCLAD